MAKRVKREKDQSDHVLEQMDFQGMTLEEVLGQDGRIKQLTGRILQRALECEFICASFTWSAIPQKRSRVKTWKASVPF